MNSGRADWISGSNTRASRSGRSANVATTSRSASKRLLIMQTSLVSLRGAERQSNPHPGALWSRRLLCFARNDTETKEPGSIIVGEHRGDLVGIDLGRVDLRALDLEQRADAAVALAPATVQRFRQLLQCQIGEPHRHPDLLAEPDRQ